jgi:hypothetical protein
MGQSQESRIKYGREKLSRRNKNLIGRLRYLLFHLLAPIPLASF